MDIQWLPDRTYSVAYPFVAMAKSFWLVGLISSLMNLSRAPNEVFAAFGIINVLMSVALYLVVICLLAALACTFNPVIGIVLVVVFIIGATSIVIGTTNIVSTLFSARSNPLGLPVPDDQKMLITIGVLFGAAYYLYIAQLGVRAGVVWTFCRKVVRRMVAEQYGARLLSLNTLSKLLGLPTPIQHIRLRRWQAVTLFFMSSICFAGVSVLLFVLPVAPSAALMSAHLPRNPSVTWLPGYDRTVVAAVNLLIVVLAIIGLSFVAGFVRLAGRRTVRSNLLELQTLDTRVPILFLRAFRDDQVTLPPPRLPLLAYLYEVGNRKTSLDVMLLEEGTEYGPVVAMGNPEDPIPPYGAARGYFSDESWQEGVSRLANDCVAVIICLEDTEGVRWEMGHIRETGLYAKTLFLLHPRFRHTDDAEDFLSRTTEHLGIREDMDIVRSSLFPSSLQAAQSTVGFFLDTDGRWQVGLSHTRSRISYLLMLRWFLRSQLKTARAF
jgi:hypothetical protein